MSKGIYLCLLTICIVVSQTVMSQPRGAKLVSGSAPVGTERRLALLIGNQNYKRADARLTNPISDADSMSVVLEALGFDVIKKYDLDYRQLAASIDAFGQQLTKDYNVGLFYYSGHGMQIDGENYLIPVDATMNSGAEVDYQCIRLGRVFGTMEGSGNKINLVLLDACRNNPFPKGSSRAGGSRGFTIPTNPPGSFVAYATRAGSTADDNPSEKNGLFTSELLKYLRQPGVGIRTIIDQTIAGVRRRSNGYQIPGRYDELEGDFVFVAPADNRATPSPASTTLASPGIGLAGSINGLTVAQREMAGLKRKKNTYLGLAGLSLLAGSMTYLLANGQFNRYTNEVNLRNATYTGWYKANFAGELPPTADLLTVPSKSSYAGGAFVLAGTAVVGSAALWIVSHRFNTRYRQLQQRQKATTAISTLYIPQQGVIGLTLTNRF